MNRDTAWYFLVERHLDPMLDIVRSLGDDHVNATPDLPGANSPYQILFHCCGMLEWWTRHAIRGGDVDRDRPAEFTSRGSVADLEARVREVRTQLAHDLDMIDPDAPLGSGPPDYTGTPIGDSAGGALLHVLEELAQHHGHLELTRDVLRAPR